MTDGESERAVVERAKAGDAAAFETLVDRHRGAVFGYLRPRLLQRSDAEDLAQEVFLRFYVARARFDSSQLIRPWLLGIARNLLREYVRARQRRREVGWTELCLELEDGAGAADRTDGFDEALAKLPECLQSLGPSAREALELRYRGSQALAAIGEKLRRSEGAVKLLMFRARQALKNCLDGLPRNGSDD